MAPVALEIRVKCAETKPGEGVYIVGSAPEFGAWKAENGIPCITTSQHFPLWTSAKVSLEGAGKVEFKIVVAREGGAGARWEGGDNKVMEVSGKSMIVNCEWGQASIKCRAQGSKDDQKVAFGQDSKEEVDAAPASAAPVPKNDEVSPPDDPLPRHETANLFGMARQCSRHLLKNEDGSLNVEMSKTPSMMLIDLQQFEDDADEKELQLVELERERLNAAQRRMESGTLLTEIAKITDFAEPSRTVLLQGFNWESHKSKSPDWYGVVSSKVDLLSDAGITDIWLPPPSQSVAPQGYLPSQLFNLNGSKYGDQAALEALISKLHEKGIRAVADIVINHRCGDKQDSQGRWNVFTTTGIEHRPSFHGVMDWQGWAVTLGDKFSDGTGDHKPGKYDQGFDAAPDIDHANPKVQKSIWIWLRWLRLQVGFDAWRFDFVKGYGAEHVGLYCRKSEPAWSVGELWCDMQYGADGLDYNQDKNRQDIVNWINATGKASTAFDFTTKGILQEAVGKCQYWRLKDSSGKPPGVIGWMPSHAVTFIDNHDTGSTQGHWPFPGDKVLAGYAYIITHPGIPSIFWDHLIEWGEDKRRVIMDLVKARNSSGIPVDAPVNIKCADNDLYVAEIGNPPALRVALGPRHSDADGGQWQAVAMGDCFRVWLKKS